MGVILNFALRQHRKKGKANKKAGNQSQRKAPRKALKRGGSSRLVQTTVTSILLRPAQAQTDPDQSRKRT